MWKQQHVVGHHSFTNVENFDPDISMYITCILYSTKYLVHKMRKLCNVEGLLNIY
jgi:hypothetical protein